VNGMSIYDTQYIINVSYEEELEIFVASFEDGDPSQLGEGDTRYLAIDNLLSNMSEEELAGYDI